MAHPEVSASVVAAHPEQKLIVASAPGANEQFTTKLTDDLYNYRDLLYDGNNAAAESTADKVVARFESAYSALGDKQRAQLRDDLHAGLDPMYASDNSYYPSFGETISAKYFAKLIGARYQEPEHILFDGNILDRKATLAAIAQAAKFVTFTGSRPTVVPGFYGYERLTKGRRQLLGRGGSDRTGAIYAAALGWDYQNWTDVDGIYTANPKIVKNAYPIPELTREEVREGAHGGSDVLQGGTIVDLDGSPILTTVLNTFNPDAPGTRIVNSREADPSRPVVTVSGKNIQTLHVYDLGMGEAHGYIARISEAVAEEDINIDLTPQSKDSLTLVVPGDEESKKLQKIKEIVNGNLLSSVGYVEIDDSKGLACITGEALRDPSISNRVEAKLRMNFSDEDIPVYSSEKSLHSPSISFIIDQKFVNLAIQTAHRSFIEKSSPLIGLA